MKHTRWLVALLLGLALWGGALGVRRAVLHQQTRTIAEGDAPFLMESALQYRLTRMVAESGRLPTRDPDVQVPEGISIRETYSVGAEYVYTWLARLLPREWTFESRIRWVSAGLFCLAVPFIAFQVVVRHGSWLGGLTAGGVLAVSPAFAVRSSGLELSRENLALPLFCFFLLAEAMWRSRRSVWGRRVWILAGAGALAVAQCVWDLTQYGTALWALWMWTGMMIGEDEKADSGMPLYVVTAGQLIAALWNPYLQAHGFLFSPVMGLLLSGCVARVFKGRVQGGWRLAGAGVVLVLGWSLLGVLFVENYSHFADLVWAKIRYLNQKPADPGGLSYAQRIMWTPALNSSTWTLTKAYFPASLIACGVAMLMLLWGRKRGMVSMPTGMVYAAATLPVYVLFFRFHVFLIVFVAMTAGAAISLCSRVANRWARLVLPLTLFPLLTGVETYHLLFFEPESAANARTEQQDLMRALQQMGVKFETPRGNRWGRPGVSYSEVEALTGIMKSLSGQGPVLAGFGLSGTLLTETGHPILLHPKFETPGIRERVREFYEHLFLHSEKELRDWAVAHGAEWYIHGRGSLADTGDTRNAPRYMVDALEPPPSAAVHLLENDPERAYWFRPVASTRMYRVYRIITPEDVEWAERMTRLGRMAYESGDLTSARERAVRALSYHWKYEPAQRLLKDVIRAAGFTK